MTEGIDKQFVFPVGQPNLVRRLFPHEMTKAVDNWMEFVSIRQASLIWTEVSSLLLFPLLHSPDLDPTKSKLKENIWPLKSIPAFK